MTKGKMHETIFDNFTFFEEDESAKLIPESNILENVEYHFKFLYSSLYFFIILLSFFSFFFLFIILSFFPIPKYFMTIEKRTEAQKAIHEARVAHVQDYVRLERPKLPLLFSVYNHYSLLVPPDPSCIFLFYLFLFF